MKHMLRTLLLLSILPFATFGQTTVDEDAWNNIRLQHPEKAQLFLALIGNMEDLEFDPALESPESIQKKAGQLGGKLDTFKADLLTGFSRSGLFLDPVLVRNDTTPRLNGRIVHVGPKREFKTLQAAFAHVVAGDAIYLEGKHDFPDLRGNQLTLPGDLAIIGEGMGKTELTFGRQNSITQAKRWLLKGLKIDCANNPFVDLRGNDALELVDCHVHNYNSGAGGSNGIFGSGSVLFLQDTVFEGSGRLGPSGGDAFDLRGNNVLVARRVEFLNNDEVVRASFPCLFDRCVSKGKDNSVTLYPGGVCLVRGQTLKARTPLSKLETTLDDTNVVQIVLGKQGKLDARTERMVKVLALERNPRYWIGLLRHPSEDIRKTAAERVRKLLGKKVRLPQTQVVKQEDIDQAIRDLDGETFATRKAAFSRLENFGPAATAALQQGLKAESPEIRAQAKTLLAKIIPSELVLTVESGRLLNWLDGAQDQLVWDEEHGAYRIK